MRKRWGLRIEERKEFLLPIRTEERRRTSSAESTACCVAIVVVALLGDDVEGLLGRCRLVIPLCRNLN